MSPIPDDFEQLRRLLALKRYEQPPPGYFHGFSRQVIVRIKAGDPGNEADASFWPFGAGSFLQRVWATLDARPAFAGAFGVAVCGFFVAGAMLSDSTAADNSNAVPLATRPPVAQAAVWEQRNDTEFSSTVGVALPSYQAPTSSLFDEIRSAQQSAKPQQVNFNVPDNLR